MGLRLFATQCTAIGPLSAVSLVHMSECGSDCRSLEIVCSALNIFQKSTPDYRLLLAVQRNRESVLDRVRQGSWSAQVAWNCLLVAARGL